MDGDAAPGLPAAVHLTGAGLSDAIVTGEQLAEAKSLAGATTPTPQHTGEADALTHRTEPTGTPVEKAIDHHEHVWAKTFRT